MRYIRAVAVTGVLLIAGHTTTSTAALDLPAGVTALGPVTVPMSDRYRFESKKVGKPFVVEVVQTFPAAPGARLPVVFVTDNNQYSTTVSGIVRSLPLLAPMIIVGIGYEVGSSEDFREGARAMNVGRTRDFTPSVDDAYLALAASFTERLGLPWPKDATTGGADAFLAFIDDELKPFIAARYSADTSDATLIGHSLGGLFALHVLFKSPTSFARYIAISPALEYDQGILFREEATLGDVGSRVFLAVGGEDEPGILAATPRLDAQIRTHPRPSLRYSYQFFPGENHNSVYPVAVIRGLLTVFDPLPPPPLSAQKETPPKGP